MQLVVVRVHQDAHHYKLQRIGLKITENWQESSNIVNMQTPIQGTVQLYRLTVFIKMRTITNLK
jgi:hypothetical protein